MMYRVGDEFKWVDGNTMVIHSISNKSVMVSFKGRNLVTHYYLNDIERLIKRGMIVQMTSPIDKISEDL